MILIVHLEKSQQVSSSEGEIEGMGDDSSENEIDYFPKN